MALEEQAPTEAGKEQSSPAKPAANQLEKVPVEDLGSEEEEQRNWKGICIALLVIATVCSLIITSVVLLSPGPDEPRVKNPLFSLEEVIFGEYEPRVFNGSWISDTEVTFRAPDGSIVVYNARTDEKTIIVDNITLKSLNVESYNISPNRKFVLMSYDHKKVFKYSYTAKYKMYTVESEQMQPFLPDMPNAEFQFVIWGSQNSQIAYVYRNNVYYLDSYENSSSKPTALTQSGEEGVIFNGIPDWLYEAEVFRSPRAVWWGPSGTMLAYAAFNDSQVAAMTYPWYGSYQDSTNVYPQTIRLRYPKPGTRNPKASLWIADFTQPFPVTEEVMPPPEIKDQDYYLMSVQWVDERRLMAVWLKRVQNASIVSLCLGADSGWMCHKHSEEESSSGWVEVTEPAVFSGGNRAYFLRQPVADGQAGRFRHVAQFDMASDRKDFLTHGSYDITQILAYHEEDHTVYYLTTLPGKPEQRHLFSVKDLNSKQPRKQRCLTCDLDEDCLYYNALFSAGAAYYVLECLGPGVPRVEVRETISNDLVLVLETNSDLTEKLENRALPQVETIKVPLRGGYEANVRLYLPPPLREGEIIKYPLILHVCGSPGSQLVTERFSVHWGSYLASRRNYIYAQVDARGSGHQGDRRVRELFRRLGHLEVLDQIQVVRDLLEEREFVDGDRVAVWGWSYGGYTAVSVLAAESPKDSVFSCGIAVAPITNWLYYDSVYSERYMQSPKPEDNYIGYEKSDVAIQAANVMGKKFLLIHGTADDDVHMQHSMMLIKALTNAGVLFRTQIYPDEKHGLFNVKLHLYQTMEDFLEYTCFKSLDKPADSAR